MKTMQAEVLRGSTELGTILSESRQYTIHLNGRVGIVDN